MSKPKSIQTALAEKLAARFARDHKLELQDPIVRTLRNRLKLRLGFQTWRNKVKADGADRQPTLFDAKALGGPK